MTSHLHQLQAAIKQACTPTQHQWLEQAMNEIAASEVVDDLLSSLSAKARRQLGRQPLGHDHSPLVLEDGIINISEWLAGDAGRVALVLAATQSHPETPATIIEHCYRLGDENERAALLRGLMLYPDPGSLKAIALEAGRTNSVMLFRALAIGNPYPAIHYNEYEFNQLVLKALFMGVNIDGVSGLQQRGNAELSRMCEDYYAERSAAGRSVPDDIWLALAPHASAKGKQLALDHLADPSPAHRYYAALGLAANATLQASETDVIQKQFDTETDARIRQALQSAIEQQ